MAWGLGISLTLVVIGLTALWLGNAGRLANVSASPKLDSPTAAQSFDDPPRQPKQAESAQTKPGS